MNKNYMKRVPQKFVNVFNELVIKNDVTVIDFRGLILSDDDFLPDGDHLQQSGAIKTSIYLEKLINHR